MFQSWVNCSKNQVVELEASAGDATTAKFARVGYSLGTLFFLLALLLLAGVASALGPTVFTVQFVNPKDGKPSD